MGERWKNENPEPYAVGSFLTGNFESSGPGNVRPVPSPARVSPSDAVFEILEVWPGDDVGACEHVEGAELGYIEEFLQDGEVIGSYVYCLGQVRQ
jgi:hypothetical protein